MSILGGNMESVVVFLLVALVGNGSALLCRNCFSVDSFDECGSIEDVQQCDATIVNVNHALHNAFNPTLLPGNSTAFKCYRVLLSPVHPNGTDTGLRGYARGCTFNSTDFCNGWIDDLNVTSCGTCTTDNCDQNPIGSPVEPATTTLAPGVVTTTLAPGVVTTTLAPGGATTTLAPGVVTTTVAPGVTTTTKPTGGASVTHIGMATLTISSILVFLVAGK